MLNPYYDADKLGLAVVAFDQPNMSYEFNTLCFFATDDGRVFTAQDSGCSCPTPFEGYAASTLNGVLAQLEQVGSTEQAERTFKAWNDNLDTQDRLSQASLNEAVAWVQSHLTKGGYSI